MNKSRRHHGFVYGYGVKRHFQQYFSYIVAVSVLLEGTEYPEKPTCRKLHHMRILMDNSYFCIEFTGRINRSKNSE
jgi:tetrahydromethanopterin S-methyltransferase subunit E